jgi:hypothetical protein
MYDEEENSQGSEERTQEKEREDFLRTREVFSEYEYDDWAS